MIKKIPVNDFLAATSVGVVENEGEILDLNYAEDSKALVDMNIIMTGSQKFVEVQGTGEEATFSYSQLESMLKLASKGINELIDMQKETLGELASMIGKTGSEANE